MSKLNTQSPPCAQTAVSSSLSIQDRIDIVNQIINEISSLDRQFFNFNGKIWYIFKEGNDLFLKNRYNEFDINLTKSISKPYEFTHGGTIWGLCKDFRDFILTGNKSNGENGYGGLFCQHWGYSEQSMTSIQELATSLGYL